uniref:axonemal 84 kDa protein-like n=1 Tax=Styela clava TaxID=7725 RepID=UPI001939C850|nr:axonemal 84 kDa protein-like [Styela clava]
MPPKSANRSGKSTPTKGQSRGGEKDKKKDEEDIKLQEEEEARKKAEQEEKERLEKELKEKEELAKLEALEESRREQQLRETEDKLTAIKKHVEILENDRRAHAAWGRYMRCDGSPDPTILTQINTFINLTKETGSDEINVILEELKDIYALIYELDFLLDDTPEEDVTPEQETEFKSTMLALQDLILQRYNEGTLKILKEAINQADTESGNLQKVIKGANETIMLWGNLNKNPRFKSFTFESEAFTFDLPKPLAMAEIAIRNLTTKYDSYSHQCSTFYPKQKKVQPAEEEVVNQEEGKQEEVVEGEKTEEGGEQDANETKSTGDDGRKSALSETAGSTKEGEVKEVEGEETKEGDDASTPAPEIKIDEIDELDDDILDEDVVDLRQYQQIGGVFHVDLVKLPPQPITVKGWTLRQVIDEPITVVEYPSEAFAPKPSSRAASAKEENRDTESPSKFISEQTQPPLGLSLQLPSDVMFFEEPQVAKWDPEDCHWKTTGVNDIEYTEETKSLSFKTRNFGTFCLMQDSHVNMPFQQWELRPLGLNHTLLTVTAAIAETFIEIKESECRLQAPEDVDARATELKHLYERWMSPRDLMIGLRQAGINIFPAEDSNKFVSIQEKVLDLEEIYEQMGLLSSAFAFCWSKWNASVTKNQIVLQVAPWLGHGDTRKMEAPPTDVFVAPVPPAPKITEDDWSLFLVDERKTHRLKITEYDDDFLPTHSPGAEFHSDLMHAVIETPFLEKPHLPVKDQVLDRINSSDKVFVHTVMTLLKATKCITYS